MALRFVVEGSVYMLAAREAVALARVLRLRAMRRPIPDDALDLMPGGEEPGSGEPAPIEENGAERDAMAGKEIIIDGFNLIITIEAALSGGILIHGRDGCIRDLSSVHGSYRSVNETDQAISLIGTALEDLRPKSVAWLLDRPISNSGRLAKRIRDLATETAWNWTVEVLFNPDAEIIASGHLVVSSDSHVLDETDRWINLTGNLLDHRLKKFWLTDLSV